jgi:hypothetical protein
MSVFSCQAVIVPTSPLTGQEQTAPEPVDLQMQLRSVTGSNRFQIGELIPLEVFLSVAAIMMNWSRSATFSGVTATRFEIRKTGPSCDRVLPKLDGRVITFPVYGRQSGSYPETGLSKAHD